MNIIKLLKLTKKFENFVKQADLKKDMAKRILLGLAHHLGIQGQAIVESNDGVKRQVDVLALRELIPGALDLLYYGTKSCLAELSHSSERQSIDNLKKDYDVIDKADIKIPKLIKNDLELNKKILEICINEFKDQNFNFGFGGEAWKKIAQSLLNICKHVIEAKKAKKSGNYDKEAKELLDLMIEINMFEGLLHNSSDVMSDLYSFEGDMLQMPRTIDDSLALERLQHTKELSSPDDIIQEIMPILEPGKTKQISGLSPYIESARQKILNKEKSKIDEEIKFIKENRRVQFIINFLKDILKKIKNVPKNEEEKTDYIFELMSYMENKSNVFGYNLDYILNTKEYYTNFKKINEIIKNIKNSYFLQKRIQIIEKDLFIIVEIINKIIASAENLLANRKFSS